MDAKPKRVHLYTSAFILNLNYLICGMGFGWSSPVLVKLPLTDAEGGRVASMLSLGMILGPFVSGATLNMMGRKGTVGLNMGLMTLANIILTFASEVKILSTARFIVGISCGITFSSVPLYIAEISEDSMRGILNTLSQIFACFGSLIVYSVGPFSSYSVLHYVMLSVCAVFFLLFPLLPNSPVHLLMKNDVNGARECLAWLRENASPASIEKELRDIQSSIEETKLEESSVMDLFTSVGNRQALIICSALVIIQQMTGITVVFFFAEKIVKMTGSDISSSSCSITIGIIMVLSAFISPLAVKFSGYKKPLVVSATGSALGMAGLGGFFVLKANGFNVENVGWLPILSIVAFITFFNAGFSNIPWALAGEMFPSDVKPKATTLITVVGGTTMFLVTNLFPDLIRLIGLHFVFLGCSICCCFGAAFVILVVQDTSKMSFIQIQEMLSGKKRLNIELGLEELKSKTECC